MFIITVISYWPGADGKSQEIKVRQSVKEKIIREFNTLTRSYITAVVGTPEYYIEIVLKNGDKVLLFENSKETVTVSVYRGDKRELKINGVSKELAGYVNRLGDRFSPTSHKSDENSR